MSHHDVTEPRSAPTWDVGALAQALDSDPAPMPDLEAGAGFSFMVGEVGPFRPFRQVILEILPIARTVRLISPGLLLELDEVSLPIVTSDQVIFEWAEPGSGERSLVLTKGGEVSLRRISSTLEAP